MLIFYKNPNFSLTLFNTPSATLLAFAAPSKSSLSTSSKVIDVVGVFFSFRFKFFCD